ncbi:winged helix-turn-helix domain-containing protein [Salaquimonas pukyongi]|uniref:winged helix-turn-helix domain-containing protein n=1 Tax=Salaquimonas pukyongi TaxID=2712698 RepID=UPI001FCD529A|nr:LysR family transcriptional regulator [Salaquimonas pukyongi]
MTKRQSGENAGAQTGRMEARLRLRLLFDGVALARAGRNPNARPHKAMLGPGKADLLELIGETGSIAAAGRAMGMSYKRAWMLVETMNAIFATPLVTSSRGGSAGGGAALTEAGREVLSLFRALEEKTLEAGGAEIEGICALLKGQR